MNSLISRMEHVIQSSVTDNQFMGSVIVSLERKILLDKGFGYANLEWKIPNSPTTKFRLASLTKQFTATAILLLEEAGKLNITDLIKKHIPDTPSTWNNITIFNLLNHSSGIPDYSSFFDFVSTTTTKTPKQLIELFRNKPLDFQPGTQFSYSDSGYVLLGYLIETKCDQSYEDFVTKNIFKPLGMDDSGCDSHSTIISHRASGYIRGHNSLCNANYLEMSILYAAASLYSTTQDLCRWVDRLFEGKIISSKSLKKMTTPFKLDYGLGVIIQPVDGRKAIMHSGRIDGFNTMLIYFPENKLTIIVLANLNAIGFVSVARDLAMKMAKLVHGNAVILPSERNSVIVSPVMLTQFVGRYNLTSMNKAYTMPMINFIISLENGYLMAETINQPKTQLFPESETKFFGKIPDVQIEFFSDKQDKLSHLILHQGGETFRGKPV